MHNTTHSHRNETKENIVVKGAMTHHVEDDSMVMTHMGVREELSLIMATGGVLLVLLRD